MSNKLKVAVLEPYYGGSHKAFVDTFAAHSQHNVTLATMPARKWKWRMRGSAIWFTKEHSDWLAGSSGRDVDIILCNDMLSAADLKALLPVKFRHIPIVVYFHENQLTYPLPNESDRDYQYGMTNITSCLAADAVWFNSQFHMDEFLQALQRLLRKMPDCVPTEIDSAIRAKSAIYSPPVELPPPPACHPPIQDAPVRLLWSHRWEYDKNPEPFFEALCQLHRTGCRFELVMLGEQFRTAPPAFRRLLEDLAAHIVHDGFLPDRSSYWEIISSCHVIVSSAIQENFGIAVVEAILAGCQPLLPNRLAYPEIIPQEFHDQCLYLTDSALFDRLRQLSTTENLLPINQAEKLRQSICNRFSADIATATMDDALLKIVEGIATNTEV